jgi:hypothetical protein
MRLRLGIAAVIAMVGLAGCNDDSRKSKPAASAESQAEDVLMADPQRALPELRRRLRSKAIVGKGFLVLTSDDIVTKFQVFPTIPPWKIGCGMMGIDLTFYYGPAPDDHVEVKLTEASISDEQCVALLSGVAEDARSWLAAAH